MNPVSTSALEVALAAAVPALLISAARAPVVVRKMLPDGEGETVREIGGQPGRGKWRELGKEVEGEQVAMEEDLVCRSHLHSICWQHKRVAIGTVTAIAIEGEGLQRRGG